MNERAAGVSAALSRRIANALSNGIRPSLQKKQFDNWLGHYNLNKLTELVDNKSWAEDYCLDVFNRALAVIESEIGYRDWQIFQKAFLNNESPEEVAAELKCSKRVVYIVQSRVLSKLRAVVDKFIEDSI